MNFTFIMNLFFHLDTYLNTLLSQYNMLAYIVVFFIIFIETGLVVTFSPLCGRRRRRYRKLSHRSTAA